MNCDEVGGLLMAEVDGELDPLRGHGLHSHLATCAACRERRGRILTLRQQLKRELPRWKAPVSLRARVRNAAALADMRADTRGAPRRDQWRWFGSGAVAGGGAVAILSLALWLPWRAPADLSEAVVALHTRATLAHRQIDVASTDRHRVRPWLSARLDYATPVVGLPEPSTPLAGARIDHLAGQPVAVLVYRRREHWIDVVARPADAPCSAGPWHTVRGFNVAGGCAAQMQWLAVSDLNAAELASLLQALMQAVAM